MKFASKRAHRIGISVVALLAAWHVGSVRRALHGPIAFERAVRLPGHLTGIVVEVLVLLLLSWYLVQSTQAAWRSSTRKPRAIRRVVSIIVLLFLGYHLATLRLPRALGRLATIDWYPKLCADLSSTSGGLGGPALFFLVGLAAFTWQLAFDGWRANVLAASRRTFRRRSRRLLLALSAAGLLLVVLGAQTILFFATGLRSLEQRAQFAR